VSTDEQWIVQQLVFLAVALDAEVNDERFKIYARDLRDLPRNQLEIAFGRARRELKFFPKIAELRALTGPQIEDEAVAAWDETIRFIERYVQSDVYGNYSIEQGVRDSPPPVLSQRIRDTVRRVGGWRVLKTMSEDDYPHVQRRFLEHYGAWTEIQQVPVDRLLTEAPQMRLAENVSTHQACEGLADLVKGCRVKPLRSEEQTRTRGDYGTKIPVVQSPPTPPTPAGLRDRAAAQRAALAAWQKKRDERRQDTKITNPRQLGSNTRSRDPSTKSTQPRPTQNRLSDE
jgi:hypothetical protein